MLVNSDVREGMEFTAQELRGYLDDVSPAVEDDFPKRIIPPRVPKLCSPYISTNLAMRRVYFCGFTSRNGSLVATYGREANIPSSYLSKASIAWWRCNLVLSVK